MTVIVDFNSLIFIIFLVLNIVLCIVKVPILGLVIGFLTVVMTGAVFMGDSLINVYYSYLLIVVGFSCLVINGFDMRREK